MKQISIRQLSLSMLIVLNACSKDSLNLVDKNYLNLSNVKKETGVQYAKAPTEPVSYLTGSASDVNTTTTAGLVLMGGSTDVDAAIAWFLTRSGGGDVVVIRSSGADGYNSYMYNMVPVNSVETIIIDSRLKADLPSVSQRIQNAEALFIAGGDQWNYVNYWKNTATESAINYLINTKQVPVGGTSAGLAILGQAYYSAEKGSVTSAQALGNPFHRYVTIGHSDFVNAPYLQNLITDSHYTQRDRQGRHISFMARLMNTMGFANIKGLGVDEQTAVCIDQNGIAKVYGINNAYFLSNTSLGAETCISGSPLTWDRNGQAIKAYKILGSTSGNGSVDMTNWNNVSGGISYFYYVVNGVLF